MKNNSALDRERQNDKISSISNACGFLCMHIKCFCNIFHLYCCQDYLGWGQCYVCDLLFDLTLKGELKPGESTMRLEGGARTLHLPIKTYHSVPDT